ncbi:substrate-binding domain-containing protein [Gynuella sunshinyii]|uniref:Transcriptional regulator n=1 Tax=Gynuella sunshinyii YC6258 TaxID=1445510 RepID=A0A0C5VXA8_9GAMM|nr:substrate-binding domain-containing protein [Gynuella sunshinyii]AJQ95069.1 transcriptional regulator [Gynuella sunshinyii YC6258]
MSVTIKDVAKLAKVSTTTVSHVLNETRFVSEESKAAVLSAVKALNYAPSAVARSLKVKNTKTLGMLVTTTLNPFYAEVIKAVEKNCYREGYNLVLCNTDGDPEKTDSYLKMLLQKRTDGILVMCTEYDNGLFKAITAQRDLPMVVMDWGPTDDYLDRIQDNSSLGGLIATKHLIENGHTDIGFIGGPSNKIPALGRYDGFKQAMAEAGLTVNPDWVIESDFECEGGKLAMRQLLALDQKPSAVFIANDMMALGALSEAQQSGIRVPEDLSVIGYDNISFSAHFYPPLTTINQPKNRLAKMAVHTLIERLEHPRKQGRTLLIEPDLVVRSSVAKVL